MHTSPPLRTAARGSLLATLALVLVACAAAPPPKPQPMSFEVESAADLNPDVNGRASPVVVRIYQLSDDSDFKNAGFAALYRSEEATLGKTLLAKQEFTAFPGEKISVRVEIANGASVLGVVVAFSDIDRAGWRLTSPATVRARTLKLTAHGAEWAGKT